MAEAYRDFLDVLVADERDAAEAASVERHGIRVRLTQTIMDSDAAKVELARVTLAAAAEARPATKGTAR